MGFILGGLTGEEYDRNYSDAQLLRRIVGYFRPHLGKMLFVALLIALNAAALALLPVLTSRGIDGALARGAQGVEVFNANLPVLLLMVAAAGLAWTFNFLRQAITARVVGDVVLTLREDVFDAAVERDMAFYDDYSTGRVVSRVTSDTQDFSNVVTLTLGLISEVLIVAIVFVILFSINVRLALITTAITPVILGAALAFRWIARRTSRQAKRVKAEVNANIQESITGIGVAKAFRQEAALHADFERVNAEAYRLGLKQGLVLQSIFPVLGFIAGLGTVVVLYYGGSAVLAGAVTRGEWFLFAESLALFWFPLTSIASFWSQFQDGLAASERVFALMDTEPQVVQTGAEPVPELEGRIEFRNVHFAYKPGSPVLQGFDLVIPAGQTVALVGHTGAGKSSLGKLIARGYEFEKGELLIDGLDIRSFDLVSYRRQLGVVQQTPYLFTGTIRDNIRYGREDASEEQVLAAARNVAGGDWLDSLPAGLDTEISEGGRGISMGQRQLVALARVLLKDPAIVILDEATASIDPLTEAQIQEGLETVLKGRTSIVIAHRLSTVRSADRIIVLSHGRILEEGTHDELLAAGGHYAELFEAYFRHQSASYDPEGLSGPARTPRPRG
ncbi:MAG: ABC transporter ATP-binding protein [Deinococcales bacterium]|nr:ABC transporter ATP-binding protein [Deinococcales bacterium]